MPIMVKYAASHITRDRYNSIRREIGWEADPPSGALLHIACFDEAGGIQSIDIWEDQASLDAYLDDRFRPALKALGVDEPRPAIFEAEVIAAAPAMEHFVLPVFRVGETQIAAAEPRSFRPSVPERPI